MVKVFVIAALLCSAALCDECAGSSGSCVLGREKLDDEMSFVQIQQVLKPGNPRSSVEEAVHSSASTVGNAEHMGKNGAQSGTVDKAVHPGVFTEPDPAKVHVHQDGDAPVLVEGKSTATIQEVLIHEIEFELGKTKYEVPTMSKLLLVLLEFFMCGLCGVDRCCMGQTCLGILKGCTFGGFFIWWFIDLVVVMWNALASEPSINSMGYVATWEKDSINPAFIIAVIWLVMYFSGFLWNRCCGSRSAEYKPNNSIGC